VDQNADGTCQADELKSLVDIGISEISLRSTNTSDTVRVGQNLVLSTSTLTRTNGTTATIGNVAMAFVPATSGVMPAAENDSDTPAFDHAAFRNAGKLAEAMSMFGANGAQGVLRQFDGNGTATNDWFAAAAG
jgi:hypothetical protein